MKKGWIAIALIIGGLLLTSDPKCTKGCRTLGEHLIIHGTDML